jgi:hypothetical protein
MGKEKKVFIECSSETALNHMGFSGFCPFKSGCKMHLDGEKCNLAISLDSFEQTKRIPVRVISYQLKQTPGQGN